ncbi:ATP-dependent acyl-CoA ligase [Mesorhizobium sp. L-8-10]|uniref:AMP-binding protein n=1 Tax=Mesorhizobium sp. L-8-10 TaxID=2744523 RepID=UPI001928D4A9|nr:AMP-binding protein [Mesorhizobium sp. L-8-10]BCH35774.1 ATP-dependent acyl-CoA ligase [Mesorhizobium sp. L-8-10]
MDDLSSIYNLFAATAARHGELPFLAVPPRVAGEWRVPVELSYRQVLEQAGRLSAAYASRGYGEGDVVALAFESRPEHILHYLALNSIGACTVPLNTDLTPHEIAYVLNHSRSSAIVAMPELRDKVHAAIVEAARDIPIAFSDPAELPAVRPDRWQFPPSENVPDRPAAVLYTSGTTGKPKGCVLSNCYALASGRGYGSPNEALTLRTGVDRVLNPLPLYHMNSLMLTAGGVIDRGACLVLPGRFSLTHWWEDVRTTGATRFHYLGLMIPALMTLPPSQKDQQHGVKNGLGAGVDPGVHAAFEERFGVPLHEVWGMTETGRGLLVAEEPRYIDTRACGRPRKGIEARIIRDDGSPAPDGEPGELVIRSAEPDPRYGFFSGYLHDPEATEAVWKDGWFHSGDICTRSPDGMFYFVDRKKNIVRRSGENISSAEVEAVLSADPYVAQVAVLAVPDAMRDEEVMACIVLKAGEPGRATAHAIFEAARTKLAYFKLPGWILFLDNLPVTGTQKVQKHLIFPEGFTESERRSGLFDLREGKKRDDAFGKNTMKV